MSDLRELSDKRLADEFDRLVTMRDECDESIGAIRAEQRRRKQAQIDKLQEELDGLK